MTEFIKKQGVSFYISAAAAVLSIVAMIMTLVSSSVVGYSIPGVVWVVVCSIAVVVLVALIAVNNAKWHNDLISAACMWIAVILSVICFGIIISARAYLVGTLWITVLDSTNPLAVRAMNTATAGFVLYIVALLMFTVCGFIKPKKA